MIYKIPHQSYTLCLLATIFFIRQEGIGQKPDTSRYGVPIVSNIGYYSKTVAADSNKRLLELSTLVPGIQYDLRYAGRDNFVKRPLYPKKTRHTFLRAPAARALALVQASLQKENLGIKVFDAYRPYSVTVTFWELIKDERYVASPLQGSGHNRGLAIDCTLIDLATGKELDMGTGFDNFTDSAHQDFTALPATIFKNRKKLREIMIKNGFRIFETEWWHYSWPNDRDYEVLDLPFQKLKPR